MPGDAIALAEAIRRGRLSASEAMQASLSAAKAQSSLGALCHIDSDLGMVEAHACDAERSSAPERFALRPFGGVPTLAKDLGGPFSGLPVAAGSRLFPRTDGEADSELAARFRGAGFCLFGLTTSPEFGLSLVAAGWVASMVNALGVTTGLLFGLLGDRVGALRLCFAGLLVSALGCLGALFAGNAAVLLASRFAEGAGMISVAVSAPSLLSAASGPHDRRFALGIWSAYLPAGVGLVMLLAPLVTPWGGWRGLWLLTLSGIVLAALAIWRARPAYRPASPAAAAPNPVGEAKQALGQAVPWLLALAMGCWTIQHYALIIWLPTYLSEQRDLSALAVSLLSCAMVLVNVPGNLLGGRLLQRHVRRGNLIVCANLVTGSAALLGIALGLLIRGREAALRV